MFLEFDGDLTIGGSTSKVSPPTYGNSKESNSEHLNSPDRHCFREREKALQTASFYPESSNIFCGQPSLPPHFKFFLRLCAFQPCAPKNKQVKCRDLLGTQGKINYRCAASGCCRCPARWVWWDDLFVTISVIQGL